MRCACSSFCLALVLSGVFCSCGTFGSSNSEQGQRKYIVGSLGILKELRTPEGKTTSGGDPSGAQDVDCVNVYGGAGGSLNLWPYYKSTPGLVPLLKSQFQTSENVIQSPSYRRHFEILDQVLPLFNKTCFVYSHSCKQKGGMDLASFLRNMELYIRNLPLDSRARSYLQECLQNSMSEGGLFRIFVRNDAYLSKETKKQLETIFNRCGNSLPNLEELRFFIDQEEFPFWVKQRLLSLMKRAQKEGSKVKLLSKESRVSSYKDRYDQGQVIVQSEYLEEVYSAVLHELGHCFEDCLSCMGIFEWNFQTEFVSQLFELNAIRNLYRQHLPSWYSLLVKRIFLPIFWASSTAFTASPDQD